MTYPPIETTGALRAELPTMPADQLLAEASHAFSYYGNAVHNRQVEREDDAIERFRLVKGEMARRLRPGA